MNFDIQFWKQCCSLMHDWRNFNNVSFERILVIYTLRWRYDYSHTPRPCRHLVTASLCFRGLFFWDALYTRNRDSERSINATIRERRFERRSQTRSDKWVLKRDSTLGKGDKRTLCRQQQMGSFSCATRENNACLYLTFTLQNYYSFLTPSTCIHLHEAA